MTDMVAALVGPDVKHHHCKINLKLPGTHTEVRYHQDFAYTPHTNDDVVTALLMIDDMTEENGCLMVVPGSHRGPMYSLFDGDSFTGFVAPGEERALREREEPILGRAGSVCLMHTRLAHGSEPNRSASPRGLYICVYSAADAFPIARNPMPNRKTKAWWCAAGPRAGAARGGGHRASRAAGAGLVLHGAGGRRAARRVEHGSERTPGAGPATSHGQRSGDHDATHQ